MTTTTPLSPLDADGVAAAVEEALAAISAASSLEELKAARLAHTGDRAPLTLANREPFGRCDIRFSSLPRLSTPSAGPQR